MSTIEINLPTGVIKKYVRNATSVVEVPLTQNISHIIMQDNISEVSSISDYIQAPAESTQPPIVESNENKADPPANKPNVPTHSAVNTLTETSTPVRESLPAVSTHVADKVVNFADLGERVSVQSPKVSIGGDNNIQLTPNQIDKSYKHKIILPASMFFIGMAVGLKK